MTFHAREVVADKLEHFIRDRFKVPPHDQMFSRTVRLWDEGYIDSIGVAEMIAFLESTFDVKISNDTVFSPYFTYIDGIARLVGQLQQSAQHPGGLAHAPVSRILKKGTAA